MLLSASTPAGIRDRRSKKSPSVVGWHSRMDTLRWTEEAISSGGYTGASSSGREKEGGRR